MLPGLVCPFRAWKLYLPTENYSGPLTDTVKHLKAAIKFVAQATGHLTTKELNSKMSFTLDIDHLLADEDLRQEWPTLKEDVKESPELVWGIFGLAKHHTAIEEIINESKDHVGATFPIVRCRIVNFKALTPFQEMRASSYNKLVTVRGTVVRVSHVRPVCAWLAFKCSSCKFVHSVLQPHGKFLEPRSCPAPKCRSQKFQAVRSHKQTITSNWQTIRLQG